MLFRPPSRHHLRNILVVGFPNVFQAGAVFMRGVILARMLPVQQFGLAVIIISVTGALDTFADAGIDRFIVQHRFGHRGDLLRTSHTFRVVGSAIVGLSIAALSYPLAIVFRAPSLWPAIAATGGVVILRGFANLSYKLQQRGHRFETETIIDTSRVLADLATAAVVAAVFHSYVAALAAAYANALAHLGLSHWRAAARYSFIPRRRLVALVGRFSTPIYVNATMLFAAMQGDRMVVAAMFSKQQLALYAAGCTVGQGLATLTGKVAERLLLPMMVLRDADRARQRAKINRIGLLMIGGSFVFLIGVAAISPLLTGLIYGPSYHGVRAIIAAAAIFQAIQIQQSWLTSVLMANGVTTVFPKITMMRAAAFPAAVVFVSMGLSLVSIPLAFALGASASLAVSFRAGHKLGLIDGRITVATFFGIALAIAVVAWLSLTGRL